MNENDLSRLVVGTAIDIHKKLGPGLLESVYEVVLAHELKAKKLQIERQVRMPVNYQGLQFDEGFRADLIVERKVIVELKSMESLSRVHKKQLLTYLRLADMRLGLLINFGAEVLRDGLVRVVNGLHE